MAAISSGLDEDFFSRPIARVCVSAGLFPFVQEEVAGRFLVIYFVFRFPFFSGRSGKSPQ
jgi:hypothetical protein